MKKNLIKNYASSITKEDILKFSIKENIILNKSELNIIYNAIKNDIDIILSNNNGQYLNNLKDTLSPSVYNKVIELFNKYKSFISE